MHLVAGFAHLGVSTTASRIYFASQIRRQDESRRYATHLKSLLLDPRGRPAIVDHGEIYDQDGRRCWGIWGLGLDREGRVMMIGRWYTHAGEEKTIAVKRGLWVCLSFSVIDVADDLR